VKEAKIESKDKETALTKESQLGHWKKELLTLTSSEIRIIKENQEIQLSSGNDEAQSWLQKSGYKVAEKDEGISLTKTTPDYSCEIIFHPYGEEDESEDVGDGIPEGEHDLNSLGEDKGSDEESVDEAINAGSEGEGKEPIKSLPFHAEVSFTDKQGNFKGRVTFSGEVGGDCRLYINELQSSTSPKTDQDKDKFQPTAIFERLSQDIQDRLYDLLDEVGIDDRLGSYIRYFADTYEDNNTIQVLENMKKIFS